MEFWKMTPKEYNLMLEGYKERDEKEFRRTAQLAAWIINPHVKKKVTVDDLIKKKRTEDDVKASVEIYNQAPDTLRG